MAPDDEAGRAAVETARVAVVREAEAEMGLVVTAWIPAREVLP